MTAVAATAAPSAAPAAAIAEPVAPAAPSPSTAPAVPAAAPGIESTNFLDNPLWSAAPSVTSDGSRIFVPSGGSGGARYMPSLRFDVWDRSGRNVQRLVVVGDDQCPDGECPPTAAAQLKAQQVAATKLLADLERKGLHPLAAGSAGDGDRTHAWYTAEGDREPSLTIDLSPGGTLTIKPRGHAAIQRHKAAWRTTPSPAQARRLQAELAQGKDACFNPAELGVPLVDLARRVAVVSIGYRGNDTCWESGGEFTLVTW